MTRPVIAVTSTLRDVGGRSSTATPPTGTPWDLHHYMDGVYVRALFEAGGVPFALPCVDDLDAIVRLLDQADGVLITGGVDLAPAEYGHEPHPKLGEVDPWRDSEDRLVVAYCQAHPELPVIATCRGIQAYNVYAGGTLIQDVPSQVGEQVCHKQQSPMGEPCHPVTLEPDSCLAEIVGASGLEVNSSHHQAVLDVGCGLQVAARAPDGVIEALERPQARWCVLVQWHPEHMTGGHEHARRLFASFMQACRERAEERARVTVRVAADPGF